ncbi:glycoside hydrolase family 55 protein [Metabacillus rhizolycopersici]|uniref:Glycoside hydrolase family 55 protein n=1 Tax=Metabacillus rhizolycopersici TaxID=2875709 RepID=A0ABS7UL41_9BACI|nr:glycoside hydrolase family 55 protein [Metabacillus rhizolycopersici]MBZ5749046.1 glycoside hydrolase family 55 protein [Metabacillus rhizolycopersici]
MLGVSVLFVGYCIGNSGDNDTKGTNQKSTKVYNVKEYGAVGDGETDDTAAIQKTIDAVDKDRGGLVFFPTGTYLISSTLKVSEKSKIQISGEGFSSIIRATGTPNKPVSFPLITVANKGSAKFIVSDLLFQMIESDSEKASGISTKGSLTDVTIQDSWFTQTNIAVKGEFVTLNFTRNTIELNKSGGVVARGNNFRKVVIANNHFFANNVAHIKLENTNPNVKSMNNITITGNQFDQGLSSGYVKGFSPQGNAIDITNASLFSISGNNFNGYTPEIGHKPAEKQDGHSVKVVSSDNFTITGNTFSKYKKSAVYLHNSSNFSVSGIVEGFDGEGAVITNSTDFEVDLVVNGSKQGVIIKDSMRFLLDGLYNGNIKNGVQVLNSTDGKVNLIAN